MKQQYLSILFLGILLFSIAACEDYTEDYPIPPASTVANFTLEATNQFVPPDTVYFYNESVVPERAGTPTFHWDFGDGETLTSGEDMVSHVYNEVGEFTVTLTLTTSAGDTSVSDASFAMQDLLLGDTLMYENFEDLTLIPNDWVLENLDGNTPNSSFSPTLADSAWVVRPTTKMEGKVAYGVSYYNESPSYADDWMILPKMSLGEDAVLTWDALSFTGTGDYPDDYAIYVSTTTQTSDGCLDEGILLKIDDESWSKSADTPGEGVKSRRLYFKDYGYQHVDVYIAFRLMTPDPGGSSLGIDNITVINLN